MILCAPSLRFATDLARAEIEHTAKQTIKQIAAINKLFLNAQQTIKDRAEIPYNKELLELLFEHPYSKIEYLVDRLKISRITASKYLKEMEKAGILQSKKVWKETIYINTALFDLLKS